MKILLDMDEVLVDFVGGVCERYQIKPAKLLQGWPKGKWNGMLDALGVSEEKFWRDFDEDHAFWTYLKPHKWFNELIALVETYDRDWHIISSPSYCISSYIGKIRWLKNRFGPTFNRFALTPHKELFAKPGTVLIDDREETITKFNAAGGIGILFPAHHNSLHSFLHQQVKLVTEELRKVKDQLDWVKEHNRLTETYSETI